MRYRSRFISYRVWGGCVSSLTSTLDNSLTTKKKTCLQLFLVSCQCCMIGYPKSNKRALPCWSPSGHVQHQPGASLAEFPLVHWPHIPAMEENWKLPGQILVEVVPWLQIRERVSVICIISKVKLMKRFTASRFLKQCKSIFTEVCSSSLFRLMPLWLPLL